MHPLVMNSNASVCLSVLTRTLDAILVEPKGEYAHIVLQVFDAALIIYLIE
jgi:hypothetical protein